MKKLKEIVLPAIRGIMGGLGILFMPYGLERVKFKSPLCRGDSQKSGTVRYDTKKAKDRTKCTNCRIISRFNRNVSLILSLWQLMADSLIGTLCLMLVAKQLTMNYAIYVMQLSHQLDS